MKAEITSDCISCGICVSINSEVFELNEFDNIASINLENIVGNEEDCRFASEICPVSAIKINENVT